MSDKNLHYVNNTEFSQAVVEYVKTVRKAEERGKETPVVTDYIADCFMKIATGLSYKSNFSRYTYRDEMVMDAVENCLRAIRNYDIEAATRTGKPNAFAYFTQISWFAFLRRIAKEKKQYDIKMKYIIESGIEEFMVSENEDPESSKAIRVFVDSLRQKIDERKGPDYNELPEEEKKSRRKRELAPLDSDLADFFEEFDE